MNKSFFDPSDSEFTRHYRDEVQMIFSGLDCILHGGEVIYCSSELTSGNRLRQALTANHLKTAAELFGEAADERFDEVRHDLEVGEGLVGLQHGELRIVAA